MFDAIFDRLADFKTPLWVIVGVVGLGWYANDWQHRTFLPRVEAAELSQQIAALSEQGDSITLEIRLRSAADEVGRLETALWSLERDPGINDPNSIAYERKQEIMQRQAKAVRYHNCLVARVDDQNSTRESIERCEKLN